MRSNNVLGIVLPNVNDNQLSDLTSSRTLGSVPFGGKYRMIDFQLSNMVNSGINKVGVITTRNFSSLMDHIGSGKAWDLAKRRGGITILPPYIQGNGNMNSIIESIAGVDNFIKHSKEEYVLLAECDCIYNTDYSKMLSYHISTGADITVLYKNGLVSENKKASMILNLDDNKRITSVLVKKSFDGEKPFALGALIIKRELLLELVEDAISKNELDYRRNIFQNNIDKLSIYAYELKGYSALITSRNEYFNANMDLMKPEIRKELFNSYHPIYTKVRDDMPSIYGLGSSVKNSLISQGCVINGEVSNSVISKGVRIGKGAKVTNCVIMQDTIIGEYVTLEHVICDKDVVVQDGHDLMGYKTYPIYIEKRSVV